MLICCLAGLDSRAMCVPPILNKTNKQFSSLQFLGLNKTETIYKNWIIIFKITDNKFIIYPKFNYS